MASLWSWDDFLRCIDADFEGTGIPAGVELQPIHLLNHMPALEVVICSALLHAADLSDPGFTCEVLRRRVELAHGLMPPRVARKKI